MSRACDVVILPAATTSFPNTGRPGDILVGTGGAIAGRVAIVGNSGAVVPINTPATDNATDLGTTALRWRTIFLGTSAEVGNSAAGAAAVLSSPADNQALLSAGGTQGLNVTSPGALCVNGAKLTGSVAGGTVTFEAVGADADVALVVRQKGADGLVLGTTTGGLAFYGGTARAKAAALTVPTDLPTCITAITAMIAALNTSTGVALFAG